jgi:hypothetical protein
MVPKQDLPSILLGLGTTPDEVAATLRRSSIQGVRNTIRHLNPVVRYVERQLALDDNQLCLEPRNSHSEMKLRLALPDGKIKETTITESVTHFLEAFDAGAFPDLELPPDKT